MVRDLFRNKDMTEFIIATIPTMLGINESSRLLKVLRKEDIPCRRMIVNQVRRLTVMRPLTIYEVEVKTSQSSCRWVSSYLNCSHWILTDLILSGMCCIYISQNEHKALISKIGIDGPARERSRCMQ